MFKRNDRGLNYNVYAKSYQIKKSLKRREKERTAMKCFDEEIMCLVILVVLVLMD
jgi:hypothetical protein